MSDWMASNDTRKQVVVQSLTSRCNQLRQAAKDCRKAYTKDFMKTPMCWLADAYDEAANVLAAKLAAADTPMSPADRAASEPIENKGSSQS